MLANCTSIGKGKIERKGPALISIFLRHNYFFLSRFLKLPALMHLKRLAATDL